MIKAHSQQNVDLEQVILRETYGLSCDSLREVLDFIQFLKTKENRQIIERHQLINEKNIQNELSLLETASLSHLEEEFSDYKNRYPKEI